MVPSPGHDLPEDLFECAICKGLLLEPVTLSCCGKSFCLECLRGFLISTADTGIARCPGGCGKKVPWRLPPCSQVIKRCIEAVVPEELEERKKEAEEYGGEPEELLGGFRAWEEVAASQDLTMHNSIVVASGTPGVVLGSRHEGRLQVIFDERLDFCHGCLDVQPFELLSQLPPRFGVQIGQAVVASQDLRCGDTLLAPRGTKGLALRRHSEDRLVVQFDERADGSQLPVNVHFSEVMPRRKLLGGYDINQRVQASKDLFANETMLVRSGMGGVVICEYSDARLTVQFDCRADGQPHAVNITPREIKPMG